MTNLLTIVHPVYLKDKDGLNPRLFSPQEQYTYDRKEDIVNNSRCTNGCGMALYAEAIGPADFTDQLPEVLDLQLELIMLNLCTGEHANVTGTVLVNGVSFPLGQQYYVLAYGLNVIEATVVWEGITLKHRSLFYKDQSEVVTPQWTNVVLDSINGIPFPILAYGNQTTFLPKEAELQVLTPFLTINTLSLFERVDYPYRQNGTFVQRYGSSGNLGDTYTEMYVPVTHCTPVCCKSGTNYVVICGGHEYYLPEADIVETSVWVPVESRDVQFVRENVHRVPELINGGVSPFRPDPCQIARNFGNLVDDYGP